MLPTYRITKSRKDGADPDYRLDAFYIDELGWLPIDTVIAWIDNKVAIFWVRDAFGHTALCITAQRSTWPYRKYVTTVGDGIKANNLANLPSY